LDSAFTYIYIFGHFGQYIYVGHFWSMFGPYIFGDYLSKTSGHTDFGSSAGLDGHINDLTHLVYCLKEASTEEMGPYMEL
jgi:hypothetical protein